MAMTGGKGRGMLIDSPERGKEIVPDRRCDRIEAEHGERSEECTRNAPAARRGGVQDQVRKVEAPSWSASSRCQGEGPERGAIGMS